MNTETGEISPDRGKSCNKGNWSGANAPGYSAECSLFVPPPGLRMAGGRLEGICMLRRWLHRAVAAASGSSVRGRLAAGLRRPVRATIRDERSDAHAQATALPARLTAVATVHSKALCIPGAPLANGPGVVLTVRGRGPAIR
jgi:hypothetical protein